MTTSIEFKDLELDEDVYYPVPNGRKQAVLKLPSEMNRQDRRAILRVAKSCEKDGVRHPYKGRMGEL